MATGRQVLFVVSCMALCWAGLAGTVEQARAAVYVVDQAAPGAADTNTGTEEKPFKTVQHAADAAKPGDTVYVMAGRYNERIKVKTSGTEGQPITFEAMPRRSAIVGGFDLDASYIRVEGFEITAEKPATAVQLHGSHCEVLDNYIHDMMEGVVGTGGNKPPPPASATTRRWRTTASPTTRSITASTASCWAATTGWWRTTRSTGCSCTSGQQLRRLRLHAVLRQGLRRAVQLLPRQHARRRSRPPTSIASRRSRTTARSRRTCSSSTTPASTSTRCAWWSARPAHRQRADWTFRHNIASTNSPTMRGGWGPDIIQTLDVTIENNTISTVNWSDDRPAGQGIDQRADPQQHPLRRRAGRRRRRRDLLARQSADRVQPDVQDGAAGGRDEHQRQGPALRRSPEAEFPPAQGQPGHRGGQGRRDDRGPGISQRLLRRSSPSGGGGRTGVGLSGRAAGDAGQGVEVAQPGETVVLARRRLSRDAEPRQRRRDGPGHEGRKGDDQRRGRDRGLAARRRRQLVGAAGRRAEEDPPRRPAVDRLHATTRPPGGSR